MKRQILIGLYGKARSGKDTAADFISSRGGFHKYAFAEPIKKMLKSVFGDNFHEGDRSGVCPQAGVSYRHMMQTLGTEWGRDCINKDLWLNLAKAEWQWVLAGRPAHRPDWDLPRMVISDVRVPNEAEWILSQGGIVIEIVSDRSPSSVGVEGHSSESGIPVSLVSIVVENNGTIKDLRNELVRVLNGNGVYL